MESKNNPKINILFPFQEGAKGGGGNQFLKALKKEWLALGLYEEDIKKSDIILFNSHQFLSLAVKAKKKFPNKIFIHRIDGPMQTYRPKEAFLDNLIFKANKFVCDGTIWQSKWSQAENKKLFPYSCPFEKVIYNAPDGNVFNKKEKTFFKSYGKVRLLAASWSSNKLKGFDFYQFLDENLDFTKYQMSFAGQSPVNFKNIKPLGVLNQIELAWQMKQHDIFITASQVESCSNALIEALSCSLPCLAFNSSSNPEVIGKGGELFENKKDLLLKIDKISKNYFVYQKNIPVFSLANVAKNYMDFANKIYQEAQSGFYAPREVGFMAVASFKKANSKAFFKKAFNKLSK